VPAVTFPQYLKRHGLYVFIAANETYLPGIILNRTGDGFWPLDDLKDIFEQNNLSWATKLVEADIPDVIAGKSKVGIGGKLTLPFLSIDGGLENNRFVDFKIGAVHQCIFQDRRLRNWNPLKRRLQSLKESDKNAWDSIKGHYIVLSTWYATEYSVDLGRALKGQLDVDIKKIKAPKVGTDLTIAPNAKIVNVSKNSTVPFAFHGKRLVGI
jgi:hypothetical protein